MTVSKLGDGKAARIVYAELPKHIGGGCCLEGKNYLIVINNTLARIQQYYALGHEIAHICLGHLTSDRPSSVIESEANSLAWDYYRLYKKGELFISFC